MKKALVTGATGFIGLHLTTRLVNDSWEVHVIVRENSNLQLLNDIQDKITIHEHNGTTSNMVSIIDNAKPDKWGDMSAQIYTQGHCNLNRIKTLSYVFYKRGMGEGPSEHEDSINKDWKYPTPNSYALDALNYVCDYVK